MSRVHWLGGVKWGYGWLTECTTKVVGGFIAVVWHEWNRCSILAACASGVSGAGVLLK